jgi:hypothetical protein
VPPEPRDVPHPSKVSQRSPVQGTIPSNTTHFKPPPGWLQIDAGAFRFYVPPEVKAVPIQGTDSLVGAYRGDFISVEFDYGMYSDSLDYKRLPGYRSRHERIGGKRANIVSYYNPGAERSFDHAIAIHFPEVNGNLKLTVHATCKTANDCQTALTLFRTIEFK